MLGNIGPMQLLIIFLIVLLIFGTKKLRNVGGDLGSAIRDFRKGMSESEKPQDDSPQDNTAQSRSSEDGDGDSDSGTTQPKP